MTAPAPVDVPAVIHDAVVNLPTELAERLNLAGDAVDELIKLLRISAGNVRSLGPAGALEALPHGPYGEWLRQLDAALARVGGPP